MNLPSALFAYAIIGIPLVAAVLIAVCLRRQGNLAAGISVGAAFLAMMTALHVVFRVDNFEHSASWIVIGTMSIDFGFLVDDLAKLMLFVVGVVGFLVHVFSMSYMKEDPNKARFFGGLSLFMFSMLGLVMASKLITLFIFWELVGLSSYILIGFYFERQSAADAAKKAFIVNRLGDFGFLLGIIICIGSFNELGLTPLRQMVEDGSVVPTTLIGLLLFCGTVGKSGQIPLHVWLPDAMEGPTPVSALIHAATMVAAGVFLLCRFSFLMTGEALQVILWIGVITAVFAGLTAVAQRDIKKILAYSTVSQLGFMVAAFALGSLLAFDEAGRPSSYALLTGGVAAAMFHLTTHAFFKALLFLGAGSIIHACHHEQDIFKMGGLAGKMKLTFVFFTIGVIALIGTPFVAAGFYSKDAILALAYEYSQPVFFLLLFGAFLTAFYMIRLWKIVFLGQANSDHARHAHENGPLITVPLGVLAIGAVLGGFAFMYPQALRPVIDMGNAIAGGEHHTIVVIFGSLAWLLGIGLAFFLFAPGAKEDRLQATAGPAHRVLANKFYFDEIYGFYVAKIQQRVANAMSLLDEILVGALIVRGLAGVAAVISLGLKALHVGSLHQYVYWFVGGLALFWFLMGGI